MGKLNTALSLKVAKEDAEDDLDPQTTAEDEVVEDEAGQTDDVSVDDDTSTDDDAPGDEESSDDDAEPEDDADDESSDDTDEESTDDDVTEDEPEDDTTSDDDMSDDTTGTDDESGEEEPSGTDEVPSNDDSEPATDEEIYDSASGDGAKLDAISKQLLELNTNADAVDEEVTESTDEQELVEEVTESLEAHYDSIVASIESGGLTAREAQYAQQVTNLHLQRAGIESVPTISTESFGGSGARVVNTQVVASGLEGRIGDLIKKMMEGLKKIAAKVADWFKTAIVTRNGLKAEAQKLLDKLPENFNGKLKVDGGRLDLFVHDGKVVSDLSAAMTAHFKLGDEIHKDTSIHTWVDSVVKSLGGLMDGNYGSLKLTPPSYLKEKSTDSRYSKFLDDGYEVRVAKAPLGNIEVYGAVVPTGTEITADNALFHAGQRFMISELDKVDLNEQEINLGNAKQVLEDIVKFYDESNAEKEMTLANLFAAADKVKDEDASFLKASRIVGAVGKNMLMPHIPYFNRTRKIASMYMRLVNEAIGETAKDTASDDTKDAATA